MLVVLSKRFPIIAAARRQPTPPRRRRRSGPSSFSRESSNPALNVRENSRQTRSYASSGPSRERRPAFTRCKPFTTPAPRTPSPRLESITSCISPEPRTVWSGSSGSRRGRPTSRPIYRKSRLCRRRPSRYAWKAMAPTATIIAHFSMEPSSTASPGNASVTCVPQLSEGSAVRTSRRRDRARWFQVDDLDATLRFSAQALWRTGPQAPVSEVRGAPLSVSTKTSSGAHFLAHSVGKDCDISRQRRIRKGTRRSVWETPSCNHDG